MSVRTTSGWISIVALVAAGACSDTSGCGTTPLPGPLPADQTLEGGAQIRVTYQGFQKLTSVVPGLINNAIGNGLCVPSGTTAGAGYCYQNDGQCTPGCKVDLQLNETTFSATNPQTLSIRIKLDLDTTIPINPPSWCFNCSNCFIDAYTSTASTTDDVTGIADIVLQPDPTTGELDVHLAQIRNVNLDGVTLNGHGGSFCDATAWFADFFKTYFAQQIVDYFTPKLDNMIRGFLPDPLGLEGVIDIAPLLASISPGSKGGIEARIVPGGFAQLDTGAQGLSLGVITGINSDENPATRGPADDSEPALCVPPLLPPDFSAAGLATTARQTYDVPNATDSSGWPDPSGSDLSVGLSEAALDLIGHHAVTSGAMCLGIGTALVPQLNVGTFGILVPSVAALASDEGTDPMLIVTRPQHAIDFSIGDNTTASPAITIHLRDFELDVYPFLYERYTRAFTMSATLDVGVNIDFEQGATGTWQIKPTLVGLEASDVTVKVLNSEFVAETAAQLEGALPSVFNLLTSQLAIPAIDLPTFAGFAIGNPSVGKATGPSGAFLTLNANLDTTAMMRQLATTNRFMAEAVTQITQSMTPAGARSTGTARLLGVEAPPADVIRAALAVPGTGALPSVTVAVDRVDSLGRRLEWSWRIGNGMWRPYSDAAPLVISDRALAWQGRYTIGVMSRVKGAPETSGTETQLPVVVDSVGPHVVTAKTGWDGDRFAVHGYDVVGGSAIQIAFGAPGADEPSTAWQTGAVATLSRTDAAGLARDGELTVFLEDEQGNRTVATVAPFHGQAGASGCSCDASRRAPGSSVLLVLLVGLRLRRRRRVTVAAA
jgi:hypothetical protein